MTLRRALFLLAVAAVPVPFFVGTVTVAPTSLVLALALRVTAAWMLDGGAVTRLMAWIVLPQALAYAGLLWIAAGPTTRAIERRAPRAAAWLAWGAAAAAIAGLAAFGARAPETFPDTRVGVPGAVDPMPLAKHGSNSIAGASAGDTASDTATARGAHVPCASRSDLRRPFFGDLHVHTTLSFDAASQDTRTRPIDAYRFARGEPLALPPYDASGQAQRTVRLATPLDFAAVTDHSEFLGELDVCRTPEGEGSGSPICGLLRSWPRVAFMLLGGDYVSAVREPVRYGFCGPGAAVCRAAADATWREIRESAEAAYDRSPECRFTTFVGYEWTRSPMGRNLHRNVLFRGDVVPALPISAVDAHTPEELWRRLRAECTEAGTGCDALAIPHNSNLSGGLMFLETDSSGAPFDAGYARERARFEPVAEVMQHKGASECLRGPGTADEQCDFEQLPYDSFAAQTRPEMNQPKVEASYLRHALKRGLVLESRLGANPFKYGFVGSTDTHISATGLVDERAAAGHGGAGMPSGSAAAARALPDFAEFNPGGLAVLWAAENTRDSLWSALRRRESYATSGPRMTVRFFGGWTYPASLCDSPDFVATGYAGGVPMGGDLPVRPPGSSTAPTFAVSAERDPDAAGRPGTPLQRIQIVKGWLDGDETREVVLDVAGDARDGAGVDLATCETHGRGFDSLCTVWTDPSFDPERPAFYYARVLENPSCRWETAECNARRVDCAGEVPPGLASCCDARVPKTIQERAWTSPIWYRP